MGGEVEIVGDVDDDGYSWLVVLTISSDGCYDRWLCESFTRMVSVVAPVIFERLVMHFLAVELVMGIPRVS